MKPNHNNNMKIEVEIDQRVAEAAEAIAADHGMELSELLAHMAKDLARNEGLLK